MEGAPSNESRTGMSGPNFIISGNPDPRGGGTYTTSGREPTLQDYENIFGPAGRDVKADLQRGRRHSRWHLPDALKGVNPWLTDRVDGLITDTTNSPFTTLILPYKYIDQVDAKLKWNVWSFDEGLASRVPYESAARTLTQTKRSYAGYTVRQGLAITMEHNFMMSEAGRQNFQNQLKQVVGSIQYTNDIDVHVAIVTAPSYAKHMAERYYTSNKTGHQIIREYVDQFGFMAKNPNAMDIMIEESKAILRQWGSQDPTFLLTNSRLTFQMTMLPEKTQYITQGTDGIKRLQAGPDIKSYRGLNIINSRMMSMEDGAPPRDILRRRVRVAEYHRIPWEKGIENRSFGFYDESKDAWQRFTWRELHNMSNVGDRHAHGGGGNNNHQYSTLALPDNRFNWRMRKDMINGVFVAKENYSNGQESQIFVAGLQGMRSVYTGNRESGEGYGDGEDLDDAGGGSDSVTAEQHIKEIKELVARFLPLQNDPTVSIAGLTTMGEQVMREDDSAMSRLREITAIKGGLFNITDEQYAQIAIDTLQPFGGKKMSLSGYLCIYLFDARQAMYIPKSIRDLFGLLNFQLYLPVFMFCLNNQVNVENIRSLWMEIVHGTSPPDENEFVKFLNSGFKWDGTNKVELVVIRPNIEHNMLGVVIGRGGLDDLGATLWGQTELSVYDDSMHGIWGMSYKYNERAIVYNERNLIRLWDVAYDGYNGGKDCRHVDWTDDSPPESGAPNSWKQFSHDTVDLNRPYEGASMMVMAFNNVGSSDVWPSPIVFYDNQRGPSETCPLDGEHAHSIELKNYRVFNRGDYHDQYMKYFTRMPNFSKLHNAKQAGLSTQENEATCSNLAFQGTHKVYENGMPVYDVTGNGHHGADYVGVASVRSGKGVNVPGASVTNARLLA